MLNSFKQTFVYNLNVLKYPTCSRRIEKANLIFASLLPHFLSYVGHKLLTFTNYACRIKWDNKKGRMVDSLRLYCKCMNMPAPYVKYLNRLEHDIQTYTCFCSYCYRFVS